MTRRTGHMSVNMKGAVALVGVHLFALLLFVTTCECKRPGSKEDVFQSEEERLHNHLFRRYNAAIRPVRKATEPVQVSLTFSLKQIHKLDEKSQMFRTYGWLIVEWFDERLSWDDDKYDNMTEFVVESTKIWTPELALINAVEHQFPDFSQYRVTVSHDGDVRWEPAGVFETSCKIDITFYPYDEQVCSLVFGTWTYTSYKVNMTNSTDSVVQDDYNTSGEWHITGTLVERKEFIYDCCQNIRFSKVEASVYLRRRHRFYTMNLVLPCAMLSSLTLVTFLSPPDQGEKISLGISILLSFSVFMLQLSENMPKTSETLPLFGVYTTFVMLMNTWSVMLTVLILNLHHRNEERPVPKWVRTLVFDGLARALCMYTRDHIRNDNYRSECGLYSSREYYKSQRKRSSSASGALNSSSAHDSYRTGSLRKKDPIKDSYSLSFAAAQFTGKVRNSSVFVPNASLGSNDTSNNVNSNATCHGNSRDSYRDSHKTTYNSSDDYKKDMETLLPREQLVTIELQEWKRVSRIVDRLFFWLTLLALISVSVVLFCLLWAH